MVLRMTLAVVTALSLGVFGCGDEEESSAAPSANPAAEAVEAPEATEAADESDEAAGEEAEQAAGPMIPPACPQPGTTEAVAQINDPRFQIRAIANESYQTGELGQFRVEVDAAEGWHVNDDFPTQLHVRASEALALEASTMDKTAAALFDDDHAHFAVPVTPAATGEHQAETCLHFAICSDETCIPVAPTVAVVLPVQ